MTTLLIIYLFAGTLRFEQIPFESPLACEAARPIVARSIHNTYAASAWSKERITISTTCISNT